MKSGSLDVRLLPVALAAWAMALWTQIRVPVSPPWGPGLVCLGLASGVAGVMAQGKRTGPARLRFAVLGTLCLSCVAAGVVAWSAGVQDAAIATPQKEASQIPALTTATSWTDHMRRIMSERCARLLPPDAAALTTGMAYGDDSGLTIEAKDALRTTGLTHLTAVSGANVALVFVLGVQSLRWAGCRRPLTLVVGIVAVCGYVVLVGNEPSVLRATVMGLVGGVTMMLGRARSSGSSLWSSIIVLLAARPSLSTEVGFVLSVLATAGIVVQGPQVCRILCQFLPRALAEIMAMTTVATVWCAPVIVWLTGYWSTFTLVANLAAAPAVQLTTFCGILATLLPAMPLVAEPLVVCAGWGARWILVTAETLASWPGARLRSGSGLRAVLPTTVLSLLLIFLSCRLDPDGRHRMEGAPRTVRCLNRNGAS